MASLKFLCCSSSDRPSQLEAADQRHARLVAATNDRHNTRPFPQQWGYSLEDDPPSYEDIEKQPLLSIDEKQTMDFQLLIESQPEATPPPAPSSRSSIVSIPSTRLTDLTAAQTGETIRTTSQRASLERSSTRGSLPPYSYYSRRSPSPASTNKTPREGERDAVWRHPVMAGNWLEVLRQDAFTRNSQSREDQTFNDNRATRRIG